MHLATSVVYKHLVEGLFERALRERVTPSLAGKLRAAGLDLSRLEPEYSANVFNHCLQLTVAELWPELSEDDGHRALGRLFVAGFSETGVGTALTGMMRILGPEKALDRLTRMFRMGGNFYQSRVTHESDHCARFWLSEGELNPWMHAAIIQGVIQDAGASRVEVEVESRDATGCTYLIRWV